MAERDAEGLRRIALWSAPGVCVSAIADFLGRFARHWFMMGLLFGGVCLAIRGTWFLDFGVAFLFRENAPLEGISPATLLQSPSFFTELLAMLLAGAVWVFAVDLDSSSARHLQEMPFPRQLLSLGGRIVLLGALPWLALVYPASIVIEPLTTGEMQRAAVGWGLGLFLTLILVALAWLIELILFGSKDGHVGARQWLEHRIPSIGHWIDWNNIIWRVLILWVMFVLTWSAIIIGALNLPAVAIFAIVGVLTAGYVFLNFFIERVRLWVVLVLIAVPAVLHGHEPFPYTFPGLEENYAACDQLLLQRDGAPPPSPRSPVACAVSNAGEFRQVRRAASLEALRTLRLPGQTGAQARLPKLVVVALSGGGYRSAFWGALVLDRLREDSAAKGRLTGLAQSIRLLTGASGGMVPASYFTMLPPEWVDEPKGEEGSPSHRLEDLIATDIGAANGQPRGELSYDSLSLVAQQLVPDNLLSTVLPWRRNYDRGRALEEQWRTLDVTFAQLRQDEAAGKRPSLIFSPMIAETGQPLLISNLDLSGITDPQARQTFDLFKEMPEAAAKLKLRTAVRMSATFPLISPAVGLPTIPALHVLDAGYFDDYGMSIALAYLKQPDVVTWLTGNTSGVILVQINAFPVRTLDSDTQEASCREAQPGDLDAWMARVLSPVTSPLSGLFSAREASMVFRNDQEFDTLRQRFSGLMAADGAPFLFERVSFENAARASFSWYLPKRDLNCMRLQLAEPHNQRAFDRLEALWNK